MSEAEEGGGGAVFRFADPTATEVLTVPGCHCPAGNHKSETITYRTQLGAGEWESINAAGLMAADGEYIDYGVANSTAIAKSVVHWTLATNEACFHPNKPHGKHELLAISKRTAALLDDTIRQAILGAIQKAQAAFAGEPAEELAAEELAEPLPNGSGARSRGSSRASASPTPTTAPPA